MRLVVCDGENRDKVCGLCGRRPDEPCPKAATPKRPPPDPKRMEKALLMIGFSRHSGMPRFGPKAQTARWGLGRDELPDDNDERKD